jgi:hypothetical protein
MGVVMIEQGFIVVASMAVALFVLSILLFRCEVLKKAQSGHYPHGHDDLTFEIVPVAGELCAYKNLPNGRKLTNRSVDRIFRDDIFLKIISGD